MRIAPLNALNRSQKAALLIVIGVGLIVAAAILSLQLGSRAALAAGAVGIWAAVELAWLLRDESAFRTRRR